MSDAPNVSVQMLNYNHLHYFHIVATEGSVAAAAQRLGVRQPTVSEQIRALERMLHVSLFERSSTGVRLTAAGRVVYEQTSVMFRAGERLMQSLNPTPAAVPHILRVGISSVVSRSTTTTFLTPMLELENCSLSITTGDAVDLVRELRNNSLDLILTESAPPEVTRRGLEMKLIEKMTLVAVAQPSAVPGPTWDSMGLVHYRAGSAFRWEVEAFLESHGYRPRVVAEADDPLVLLEAAAGGGYIAFVPQSIAKDSIECGRLSVFATLEPVEAGVHALFQADETIKHARKAVDILVARARKTD